MLVFYFAPGASSMATHIALHEVGATFEPRPLSFAKKEQHHPDFLAVNPEGLVPTLVVDGRCITEVAATLYYLARRYPEAKLLPGHDLVAEAQALSWMSFIATTIHWGQRRGMDAVKYAWGMAEAKMTGREWALERYSIADIHLFRLFWRLMGVHPTMGEALPTISAHYRRMMARPAVKRTIEIESAIGYELPQWQPR